MQLRKCLRFFTLFSIFLFPLFAFPQNTNSVFVSEKHFVGSNDRATNCDAPFDFSIEIDTVEYDQYQLNLSWSMVEHDPGWIHWDDGENYTATVAGSGSDNLYAAARWDPFQLSNYDGFKVSKIRAYLYEAGYDSLVFHIWTDSVISNPIYSGDHDTLTSGAWVEHELDNTIYLDASTGFWVGYKIMVATVGRFYLGCDNGPAIAGYGDLISTDYVHWDPISSFGLDYNFNIQFYVEDTAGNEMQVGKTSSNQDERNVHLSGYNLYRSIDGGDYELLEFIPYEPGDTSHSILFDANPYLHCYQLTAVWESSIDTCESAPALAKENPDENYVCVLLVGEKENIKKHTDLVKCFPNPFSNSTTFEFDLNKPTEVLIAIFNQFGEQIKVITQKQSAGRQQIIWDAEELKSGIYFYTFQVSDQVVSGKLVLMR